MMKTSWNDQMCTNSHSCETQDIESLFRTFNGIINTDHNLSFRQKFLDKVQSNFINIISTSGLISQLNWIDTLGSSTIENYPSLSSSLIVTSALTKYFNYTPITIDSQRPSEYEILQFYVELSQNWERKYPSLLVSCTLKEPL